MRFTLSVFLRTLPPAASAQAPQAVLTRADAVRWKSAPRNARSPARFPRFFLSNVLTFIAPPGAIRG